MEFPDLGAQCDFKECQQLDFLPFKCNLCTKTFCLDHRQHESHNCEKIETKKDRRATVCPACSQPVNVLPNEDPNQVVNRHIERGCKEESKKKRCAYRGCKSSMLVPINCSYCNQDFCLTHRQGEVHRCEGLARAKQNLRQVGPFLVPTSANKLHSDKSISVKS